MRQHVVARLAFTRRYVRWTQQEWMNVVFSDESPYPIERQDGRKRCWRRKCERLAPGCVSTVKDKRSVMVWGAIGFRVKSPLVVIRGNMDAVRYRNEILIPHVLPLINNLPNQGRLFQQDNAAPPAGYPGLVSRT